MVCKALDNIHDYVLKRAPQNDQITSPVIQKDVVTTWKIETIKAIIEEVNDDHIALLIDQSFHMSRKEKVIEKMIIVLQYIDQLRFVIQRYID